MASLVNYNESIFFNTSSSHYFKKNRREHFPTHSLRPILPKPETSQKTKLQINTPEKYKHKNLQDNKPNLATH